MERILVPELLDHLDPSDPRARRSRCDLKLIDNFLGNSRWVLRRLTGKEEDHPRILELGAGEGLLCRRILGACPGAVVTGLDLIPPPDALPDNIRWIRGDFLQQLGELEGDVLCGLLILHHLDDDSLRRVGAAASRFRRLLFAEPLRSELTVLVSRLLFPIFGQVTRHDMPASIRAGFRKGELAALLGLDRSAWIIEETETLRGSLRFSATRR